MKSPYYFLQRSKRPAPNHRNRYIALTILLVAVLFAVIMHLPKPKAQAVTLSTKPRTTPTISIPEVNTFTVDQQMPYGTTYIDTPTLPTGTTQVKTPGVSGIWTKTYQTSTVNGKVGPKRLVNITTTRSTVNEVILRGTGN